MLFGTNIPEQAVKSKCFINPSFGILLLIFLFWFHVRTTFPHLKMNHEIRYDLDNIALCENLWNFKTGYLFQYESPGILTVNTVHFLINKTSVLTFSDTQMKLPELPQWCCLSRFSFALKTFIRNSKWTTNPVSNCTAGLVYLAGQ